jgi:hypothetical protein
MLNEINMSLKLSGIDSCRVRARKDSVQPVSAFKEIRFVITWVGLEKTKERDELPNPAQPMRGSREEGQQSLESVFDDQGVHE